LSRLAATLAEEQDVIVTDLPKTVQVLPGVPGMPELRVDDDRVPYPDTTIDMVKVLRERGLDPQLLEPREERRYAGHKALEIWFPILLFAKDVLANFEAGLLVELLKAYFGGKDEAEKTLLHVDWRVTMPDGREERFKADGKGSNVLEALDAFEQRLRDL